MPLTARQIYEQSAFDLTPELIPSKALNPMSVFQTWFQEAALNRQIIDANSVNLATVSPCGQPSNRIVTMKEYDTHGFVFLTHSKSHKGQDVSQNPKVSLCFYWEPLERQVRVEGRVVSVSCREADTYFAKQPREHQVRAWVSEQSNTLKNLSELKQDILRHTQDFGDLRIPRPPSWTGYRVQPDMMEFWQRGEFGIDSRDCFLLDAEETWARVLLSP